MSSRPLGLRRRDGHLVCIVGAVFAFNVATTACYWFAARRGLRASAARVEELAGDVERLRASVSDSSDALRAALDALPAALPVSGSADVPDVASARPVVQGVGRTKSARGTPILYVDRRFPDGTVQRDYITPQQYASMLSRGAVGGMVDE